MAHVKSSLCSWVATYGKYVVLYRKMLIDKRNIMAMVLILGDLKV